MSQLSIVGVGAIVLKYLNVKMLYVYVSHSVALQWHYKFVILFQFQWSDTIFVYSNDCGMIENRVFLVRLKLRFPKTPRNCYTQYQLYIVLSLI